MFFELPDRSFLSQHAITLSDIAYKSAVANGVILFAIPISSWNLFRVAFLAGSLQGPYLVFLS